MANRHKKRSLQNSTSNDMPDVEVSAFKYKKRIGEGAYGIVYQANEKNVCGDGGGGGRSVAVKRNVVDAGMHGIMSLKEADMFSKLSTHPHIVDCIGMFYGGREQFPDKIGKLFDRDSVDDKIHFVLGCEHTNIDNYIKLIRLRDVKIITIQLFLAIEWMHLNSIAHRDIKPANILVSVRSKGGGGGGGGGGADVDDGGDDDMSSITIKICDFGLSGYLNGCDKRSLSTPGIVTSWYRAPEICMDKSYCDKVDMWSAGTVLFEILSRVALLTNSGDEDIEILTNIIKKTPEIVSMSTISEMGGSESISIFNEVILPKLNFKTRQRFINPTDNDPLTNASESVRKKAVAARIRVLGQLSDKRESEFTESSRFGGSIHQFYDLISHLIVFNPDERMSATDALNTHPFFTSSPEAVSYIQTVRKGHNVAEKSLPVISICDCPSRRIAYSLIVEIYNNRFSIEWYSHRILFHALDAFDRYIEVDGGGGGIEGVKDDASEAIYLKMYTLLYMFHKLFTCLDLPEKWNEFAPTIFSGTDAKNQSISFEMHVFENVFKREIYRDTIYEVMTTFDSRIRESKVRECIVKWGGLSGDWSKGSVRALYRDLMTTTLTTG